MDHMKSGHNLEREESLFEKKKKEGWEENGKFGDYIILTKGEDRLLFDEKNDSVYHVYPVKEEE